MQSASRDWTAEDSAFCCRNREECFITAKFCVHYSVCIATNLVDLRRTGSSLIENQSHSHGIALHLPAIRGPVCLVYWPVTRSYRK